ncbi:MAG: LD-carboxypeptidase [Bdellovibrionales bacterium]|nr:LD-carboxypeptidase [Bdellovibrionales bacterium]
MVSNIVDIVAPASSVSVEDVKRSLKFLKKMNLKPRLKGPIKGSSLFAQSDSVAFENFKRALWAKDSFLIWSLRGGYGSTRLLKFLSALKKAPEVKKVFIGHSDVTVLHDWIHQRLQWPTLHFPVLREMLLTSVSSQKKFNQLISGSSQVSFSNLKVLNKQKNKKIISQITGGNITLIQNTIGTPWNVSRKGIFFLEDVNEEPYRVHRALWQMKNSGVFKKVRAVIFGRWQKEYNNKMVQQVLKPFAREVSFPVLLDLPCGHGKVNDPLPFGTRAELNFGKGKAFLKVNSPFINLEES